MSQTPQDRPANQTGTAAPVLPNPPRTVTPAVRRQAWNEPGIRATWLGAIVVVVALIYLGITSLVDWRADNQLFAHGVTVQATAFVSGSKSANRLIKSDYTLDISYAYDGKPFTVVGSLADADSAKYYTGQPFEMRVDPSSPTNWTTSKEGIPLYARLVGVYILSACALVLFLIAIYRHWRKIRLWKLGEVHEVIVDSHGQSALAPRSTVVRCHLAFDRRSATIFQVYVPPGVPAPPVGGRLRLICDAARPSHYLVADAYAA